MNIEIRKETPQDYFETEAMTKRSFYNVYGPGCDEHLLVHKLRTHKDYLTTKKMLAVDAPEYTSLADGDKEALKHLVRAAVVLDKINN